MSACGQHHQDVAGWAVAGWCRSCGAVDPAQVARAEAEIVAERLNEPAAIEAGQRRIFRSSSVLGAPGFPERSGEAVTVLRPLTSQEADLAETGPMYRIAFTDRVETDAFEEELLAAVPVHRGLHRPAPGKSGTTPGFSRCIYCLAVTEETDVPGVDDDAAWAELAIQHADGCEWVITRAHRIGESS